MHSGPVLHDGLTRRIEHVILDGLGETDQILPVQR